MIRLIEFDVVAFIFYYFILLAIATQVDGGKSVLDITVDHCLKYCNQDCVKYSDSVLLAGKPLDNNAQKEREECELAQMWCDCNPDPSTWGLDCRRHCHHCKLLIFTRRKILCQEENRRCDCGSPSQLGGSGDNGRLWASYGRPGISLWGLIVVLSLVLSWKRHLKAKNQMEIGNRRRHVQNERHWWTNNTYYPPTREASSTVAQAENGPQAPTPRQILLADVAPPPEYEPPPPYPGIAKPGK